MNNILLKQQYETLCNEYVKTLCKNYEWDFNDGWWICDLIGDVFCTSDITYSLNMFDIKLLVDENVSYEDFNEWWETNVILYNLKTHYKESNDFDEINLYSWLKGNRPKFTLKELKQKENEIQQF